MAAVVSVWWEVTNKIKEILAAVMRAACLMRNGYFVIWACRFERHRFLALFFLLSEICWKMFAVFDPICTASAVVCLKKIWGREYFLKNDFGDWVTFLEWCLPKCQCRCGWGVVACFRACTHVWQKFALLHIFVSASHASILCVTDTA